MTFAPGRTRVAEVLEGGGLRSVFQPIVDLDSLTPVAFEALARGPRHSDLESPAALFAQAEQEGLQAELDHACRRTAYLTALAEGLDRRNTLFVNVEPRTLTDLSGAIGDEVPDGLRVMFEITERAIGDNPAEILAAAQAARRAGFGIALDDVGADPRSLALLPFIDPDVIKLDLRLIQDRPDREIAEIMTTALAHAERRGSAILAEGIETPAHLRRARALGARFGQGYLFARPGPLADAPPARPTPIELLDHRPLPTPSSPYAAVSERCPVRVSTKELLVELSIHLEEKALGLGAPGVLVSCFQDADHLTANTRTRYHRLAQRCALVAALGTGIGPRTMPGVRGAHLEAGGPLTDEWSVVVVGGHYAAALVARDLGDRGPESDRRFSFALTHDRDLAVQAATALMRRVVAEMH